ncbi:protein FAR1-RELATED SEQUENCE 5-like [Silene latifolia]|uniref:protein FAR1-RELATED SEQUENCE 5-like n=1 Tax=Silene latifolia TaxID=37657 RepID=UPI003D76AFD3
MSCMDIVAVENVTDDGTPKAHVTEEEFCWQVEDVFTPYVGMQFGDIEEAITFYNVYALAIGFDVRKYTTKKWRDGAIKSKLLVCNREGFTPIIKENISNEGNEVKQKRRTKLKRMGCKARIRLFLKNGVLLVDQFHEGHNHELVSVKDREFQKLSKNILKFHMGLIVANSRLNIGATKTYRMCKELVKGFENIGASLNDFKNFQRDIKCFVHERDGQLFIDRFKSMAETQLGFYFDYDVDSDGSLRRAIWADGIARRNYVAFGDAVSYDPTYSTNKFLIAMGSKEPEYLITDHGPGIMKAFPLVFKTTRHRFCMWHITNKVPTKYGSSRDDYQDFLKKLNAIIWDEDLEAEEFDGKWLEIMDQHIVGDVEWFVDCYSIRKQWVMAHCKDLNMGVVMRMTQRSESENSFFKRFEHKSGTLVEFWMRFESAMEQQRHNTKRLDNENRQSNPKLSTKLAIESDGARVYTHYVFEEFQEEVKYSTDACSCKGFVVLGNLEVSTVMDAERSRNFEVQFNPGTLEARCTCRLFERRVLLCRHIIWIYSGNSVKKIPEYAVARRWSKDAVRGTECICDGEEIVDMDIIDAKQLEMTKLWSEVYETVGLLGGRDKEDVDSLFKLIRDFREMLLPSVEELSKKEEMEKLLGCKTSKEITILPPKYSKNKGSGKRLLSRKSKAIAIARKPKRMCNNCKQMGHHDKRNCPNPFAERPPPLQESSEEEEEEEEEDDEEKEEGEEEDVSHE